MTLLLQMLLMYTCRHTIIMLSNWHLLLIKDHGLLQNNSVKGLALIQQIQLQKKVTTHLYIAAL